MRTVNTQMLKVMGYCKKWGVEVVDHMLSIAQWHDGPSSACLNPTTNQIWTYESSASWWDILHELSHLILGGNPASHPIEHESALFALDRAHARYLMFPDNPLFREYEMGTKDMEKYGIEHRWDNSHFLALPDSIQLQILDASLAMAVEQGFLTPAGKPIFRDLRALTLQKTGLEY